jgi:LemA protein
MLAMVSYPRRPQSGQITCYLNRTYHVLTTSVSGVTCPFAIFSATFTKNPPMSLFATAAVALLLTGLAIYGVILYNELVRLRIENDRAFANIDVLLKQLHDEIPNLVSCVRGYMNHERQTLEAVALARTASIGAASIPQKAQADLRLTGALHTLFAVAERYPELKANQNFLALQKRISELEERIADRREFFNDDVATYNTRIAQLPEVFLARQMKLRPRQLFQVSEQERQQVELKLARAQGTA